ncbi:MAG: hypothetical protein GY800_04145 [Planctomycetes bacterium]|nr:hypothetical protein [Planctomycetota bacterium]
MGITDKQIQRQIENATAVEVYFTDAEPGRIRLMEQGENHYIKPVFCNVKQIPHGLYEDLVSRFTGEKEFNTDPEIINSGMEYDEFFDKYYNKF